MTIQHRTIQFDAATGDSRQVEASLSSELPVFRSGMGNEILQHTAEAIDFTRAPLPLITSHDQNDLPIGIVENIRIVGRRLRGLIRFGDSERASEIWEDVKAGVLRSISIGYQILDGYREGDNYIVTRWQPLEISLVSVPADHTVGIGRSLDLKETQMNTTNETAGSNSDHLSRSQRRAAAISAPGADFRERQQEIEEIIGTGKQYKATELAMEFVQNGRSIEEFRQALLDRMATSGARKSDVQMPWRNDQAGTLRNYSTRNFGMNREAEGYSLLRAVNAMATNDWSQAGFEREMSQELARSSGRNAKGIFVPYQALTRVMTTGGATTGSTLVPTQHDGFVELLRNHCRVIEAGATVMGGLSGTIEIPKQTAAATAEWLAEDDALSGGDLGFGAITMTPKTVGAMLKWSRRMTHSASPEIEQIARNDLAQVIATAIDRAALHGLGSGNQPTGVYAASNVNSVAMGGVPTHGKLVDMAAELGKDNSLQGRIAYMTTPGLASKLAQTLVAASAGSEMIWSGNLLEGSIAGFNAYSTNQVSSTLGAGAEHGLILGNWAELIIGMWGGGVDVIVDPYTDVDRGRIRITTFCDMDIALRHPESFCKATGATTV